MEHILHQYPQKAISQETASTKVDWPLQGLKEQLPIT